MVASGLRYSLVASGCPIPIPSRKRPGCSPATTANCAATSAGSCCQTLRMPVATVIADVASRYARISSTPGLPPIQSVPNPSSSSSGTVSMPCRLVRQMPIVPSSMRHRMPGGGSAQSR